MNNFKKQINSLVDTIINEKSTDIDSVQLFNDLYLIACDVDKVTVGDYHRAYLIFCAHRSYVAVPLSMIARNLRAKGLEVTSGRHGRYYIRSHSLTHT